MEEFNIGTGKCRTFRQANTMPSRQKSMSVLGFLTFGRGRVTSDERVLLDRLTSIGTPVTVGPGASLDLNLEDKTLQVARIAAQVGIADEYEDLRQKDGRSCCYR